MIFQQNDENSTKTPEILSQISQELKNNLKLTQKNGKT